MKTEHIFIGKSIFFPETGILAIGDLHVGYEHALIESGILIPEQQVKDIIEDLRKIIEEIKIKRFVLKKIVFLGDIKHYFNYEWKEKFNAVQRGGKYEPRFYQEIAINNVLDAIAEDKNRMLLCSTKGWGRYYLYLNLMVHRARQLPFH